MRRKVADVAFISALHVLAKIAHMGGYRSGQVQNARSGQKTGAYKKIF
jgi:hypothetical protein